ncbi:hypothetical protein ACFE04_008027 [Oxalis oulophora]
MSDCNVDASFHPNSTINRSEEFPIDSISGEGSVGARDAFRTYKRRRRVKSVSDTKPNDDDGRGLRKDAADACRLVDQGDWKNIVMEKMHQSSSDVCTDNAKDLGASDKSGSKPLFTKKLVNGVPNETCEGAMENGSLHGSNHCTRTEKCQHALLNILKSEKFSSLSKLLSENFQGAKADRLLNLKIINSRMKDGAYERLPVFFLDDVQQAWRTILTIESEMTSIARSLSDTSRTLYIEQFGTVQADFNVDLEKSEHEVCICKHCGDKADGTNCLVCDSCEEVYHVSCIEPFIDNILPNCWYCTKCTATGIVSPHENCVVCERLEIPSSHVSEDCGENLGICKICDGKVQNSEKLMICEHPYCPNKLCLVDKDDESIVLCDGCDNAYHIYCMIPPRASIPEGEWFCGKCEAGINRLRTAGEIYVKIEKKRKRTSEECIEGSEKVGGGTDMV